MLDRRKLLRLTGACSVAGLALAAPRALLADVPTDRRLVVVILRGALDGLAAVPPFADPAYAETRGELALPEAGLLALDRRFALHPALATLARWHAEGEAVVLHAVATSYRERSHFEGQDLLETGLPAWDGSARGWLNRALELMGDRGRRLGLAVGASVPLILRGTAPVASWAPQAWPEADADLVARIADLYGRDPGLGPVFMAGLESSRLYDRIGDGMAPRWLSDDGRQVRGMAEQIGRLLAAPDGMRVAVIELNGWDTHAGQGGIEGRLANRLRVLDNALAGLRQELAGAWEDSAVVCVTEFGRTAAANGSGGTDHGTASVAFLAGGNVSGGRVLADWPGLERSRLLDGRDLAPTSDLRSLLKAALVDHLGLEADGVERLVFPDSGSAARLRDLFRA